MTQDSPSQDIRKIHDALQHIEAQTPYAMGVFNIPFQDGPVVFKVYASYHGESGPRPDALFLVFAAESRVFKAWLLPDGSFQGEHMEPLHPAMENIARDIIETDKFTKRYTHLLYLIRKQVLQSLNRYEDPFEHRIHAGLLGIDKTLLEQGSLGSIPLPGSPKPAHFFIGFCDDPKCFCETLFLEVSRDQEVHTYQITEDGQWRTDEHANATTKKRFPHVKKALKKNQKFLKIADYMRTERRLHNFHRYCKRYEETNLL